MSLVSAAITAQLNINDLLAWQVLAGQRRGERGMTLDKTRDKKEKWRLYLTDSPLSLSTCVYVCVPSANSWLDMTVLLPCFSSPRRRWTSLYSHCPSSFLHAFLTFLQVSVHVCKVLCVCRLLCSSVSLLICRSACVSFMCSCASWREHPGLWCRQQWWWWRQVTGKSHPRGSGSERRGGWERGQQLNGGQGLCWCCPWLSLVFSLTW